VSTFATTLNRQTISTPVSSPALPLSSRPSNAVALNADCLGVECVNQLPRSAAATDRLKEVRACLLNDKTCSAIDLVNKKSGALKRQYDQLSRESTSTKSTESKAKTKRPPIYVPEGTPPKFTDAPLNDYGGFLVKAERRVPAVYARLRRNADQRTAKASPFCYEQIDKNGNVVARPPLRGVKTQQQAIDALSRLVNDKIKGPKYLLDDNERAVANDFGKPFDKAVLSEREQTKRQTESMMRGLPEVLQVGLGALVEVSQGAQVTVDDLKDVLRPLQRSVAKDDASWKKFLSVQFAGDGLNQMARQLLAQRPTSAGDTQLLAAVSLIALKKLKHWGLTSSPQEKTKTIVDGLVSMVSSEIKNLDPANTPADLLGWHVGKSLAKLTGYAFGGMAAVGLLKSCKQIAGRLSVASLRKAGTVLKAVEGRLATLASLAKQRKLTSTERTTQNELQTLSQQLKTAVDSGDEAAFTRVIGKLDQAVTLKPATQKTKKTETPGGNETLVGGAGKATKPPSNTTVTLVELRRRVATIAQQAKRAIQNNIPEVAQKNIAELGRLEKMARGAGHTEYATLISKTHRDLVADLESLRLRGPAPSAEGRSGGGIQPIKSPSSSLDPQAAQAAHRSAGAPRSWSIGANGRVSINANSLTEKQQVAFQALLSGRSAAQVSGMLETFALHGVELLSKRYPTLTLKELGSLQILKSDLNSAVPSAHDLQHAFTGLGVSEAHEALNHLFVSEAMQESAHAAVGMRTTKTANGLTDLTISDSAAKTLRANFERCYESFRRDGERFKANFVNNSEERVKEAIFQAIEEPSPSRTASTMRQEADVMLHWLKYQGQLPKHTSTQLLAELRAIYVSGAQKIAAASPSSAESETKRLIEQISNRLAVAAHQELRATPKVDLFKIYANGIALTRAMEVLYPAQFGSGVSRHANAIQVNWIATNLDQKGAANTPTDVTAIVKLAKQTREILNRR
jgi:hypothetical protein